MTFLRALERRLNRQGISFKAKERHIRYVSFHTTSFEWVLMFSTCSCFPHIVNLACKAVLNAFTDDELVANERDYTPDPDEPSPQTFEDAVRRDPIATLRSLIRTVSHDTCLFVPKLITVADSGICSAPAGIY
jgi:hypothetical protein